MPPQAGGAWPIIGHLHKLSGTGLPHMTLGAMADQYGSAFTIQLGMKQALVVSSWKVAKECFTTNDRALASRPSSIASKIMGYNNGTFALAPYGQYWREVRKIAVQEFLSNLRLVVGKRWFGRNVSGVDEAEVRQCQRTVKRFFTLAGTFMVEDSVPLVGWLDVQGYRREMRSIARELERMFEGLLEEHKCRRRNGKAEQEQDFMDVMLSALTETSNFTDRDPDTVNKATCLTLILGASDTTMVTLTWTLSLLLNNPHVLKKAQEELMAQVGNDRLVDESDIKNLVYLQAIIKETIRLYPPAPLSAPREAIEDVVVAGYHVPVGMRVIVNLWKIQRDPSIWTDPLEFQPERFLTTHKGIDVWGQHYEFTPFGSGRRSCPGIALALQVVQLTLARLLHEFELIRPSCAPVDMTESVGLTNVKVTPIEVLLAPRLPPQLYKA
ncbi:hypothetical protein Syun_015527 [Stephania yunnanensis]|uniref:Cytochrome P450 n=1 Tax=Stephania yunnanensis TaxID=152371 RepID=A0AAP0JLI4_9MAGN